MGKLTAEQRSYCMSRITSSNTTPELKFRKMLWLNGIRGYRVKTKIMGKPDIFFGSKKVAVFIDGCYWHSCKEHFIRPKSNNDYWDEKIARNIKRDKEVNKWLRTSGVNVLRFWEHDIKKNPEKCISKLQAALQ